MYLDRTKQGRNLSLTMVNTAFSKDIMKDRATTFNISDIFNSSKRRSETIYLSVSSYSISMEKEVQFIVYVPYK
jgi:hypothetical protein